MSSVELGETFENTFLFNTSYLSNGKSWSRCRERDLEGTVKARDQSFQKSPLLFKKELIHPVKYSKVKVPFTNLPRVYLNFHNSRMDGYKLHVQNKIQSRHLKLHTVCLSICRIHISHNTWHDSEKKHRGSLISLWSEWTALNWPDIIFCADFFIQSKSIGEVCSRLSSGITILIISSDLSLEMG